MAARNNKAAFLSVFQKHVPPSAAEYCYKLWEQEPFNLKVSKPRLSKLGDYTYNIKKGHSISVNVDLNPFSFLITYLHEFAHLKTTKKFGRSVKPHGTEWQKHYQDYLGPVTNTEVFPIQLLTDVQRHLARPKASSCSDPKLVKALMIYDDDPGILLEEIEIGDQFIFRGQRYKKLEDRRTRSLCLLIFQKRKYTISKTAKVELV